jgi:hypothetical protein
VGGGDVFLEIEGVDLRELGLGGDELARAAGPEAVLAALEEDEWEEKEKD